MNQLCIELDECGFCKSNGFCKHIIDEELLNCENCKNCEIDPSGDVLKNYCRVHETELSMIRSVDFKDCEYYCEDCGYCETCDFCKFD